MQEYLSMSVCVYTDQRTHNNQLPVIKFKPKNKLKSTKPEYTN